ncbi:DUF721 domain-containing protein [Flavobacterium sp. 20NA77.7]|uniref:DUF721 domain-containing protein n=1 Tax=Flavobacterium nakdongensis TaxID=3073563 RepID=A0ABY9RCX0_9FLAO|nr:DUF721 domain-containing protein [Flavobacterium sp. 20NA77.7]WMW78504.1 DUF721 domain-containing protein [Flavobacterium sp. 20NA77.7]
MKRFNDDYTIGDIMKEFIKESKLEKGLDVVQVKELWASLMGPTIVNYTTQVDFYKNILYVTLSSAVLKQELALGKQKIIDLINKELQKKLVKDLIFR